MKKLHCLLLGIALTATLRVLAADTNSAQTPRLKGLVVDSSGQPVEGATVECLSFELRSGFSLREPQLAQRAVTKTDGSFEIDLAGRMSMILVRKSRLGPAWRQFSRPSATEQRFVLTAPAVLAGVVVDEKDKPVADAEVSVATAISETEREGGGRSYDYLSGKSAQDVFHTRTTGDGRFRIEGFRANASADLDVQAPGQALRQTPREYTGPETMQCRAGQEDIRLIVEPAGTLEGKIVAEDEGPPLPPARLFLQPEGSGFRGVGNREPRANADGTFRIADVAAGSYLINASFGTNVPPDWVAEMVPVSVGSGETVRDLKITATRGALLEVAVRDRSTHQPLAMASVNAYKQGSQAVSFTDGDGIARLRVLPGDYQISVGKEGAISENTTASVEANKTNRLEIELSPSPKIAGVVRRPDGQPAAGLAVRLIGGYVSDDTAAKTDSEGRFDVSFDAARFRGQPDSTICLLIRDAERNLAVAQDLEEDTGPLDLRLAPGLTFVGRAECDGKPITNATATLVFWTGNSGRHLTGLSTGTNIPGRFEISALPPGRRYGIYVSAPGYGQKYVNTAESEAAGERVELDPVELKPANLKLVGQVVDADDRPVAGASVHLSGDGQPNASTRTGREGRFRFEQVCEGLVRLSANARSSYGSTSAEGGETNVVLRLGESSVIYTGSGPSSRKLKGVVTDPDGKPVAGAQLRVFPTMGSPQWIKTGADGSYSLNWSIQPWQLQQGGDPCLVVRDAARALAASEDITEGATNINVKLAPALTLTGRVEDVNGKPLTGAQVGVWLLASRTYSQVNEPLASTDAKGIFEIKTLPTGRQYVVFASAKGYGRRQTDAPAEGETNRVEIEPFVLDLADKMLSGQVLNPNDKPASGVHVSLSGDGQPQTSVTTDSKGRFSFKVCEGQVRIFASGMNSYASVTAEAGDTNVVIQLSESRSSSRAAPRRAGLKGNPLPDLTPFGLAADAAPAGKPLLLCLLDVEQRPSRRVARLLGERYDELRQKGLAVAGLQAALATPEQWDEWKTASPVPYPVGRVTEKSSSARWATGVSSLPWLILRDAEGKVVAEGFSIEELDATLGNLKKK